MPGMSQYKSKTLTFTNRFFLHIYFIKVSMKQECSVRLNFPTSQWRRGTDGSRCRLFCRVCLWHFADFSRIRKNLCSMLRFSLSIRAGNLLQEFGCFVVWISLNALIQAGRSMCFSQLSTGATRTNQILFLSYFSLLAVKK